MKLNTLVKKLFVIVALGGFCMPAQAMLSSCGNRSNSKPSLAEFVHKMSKVYDELYTVISFQPVDPKIVESYYKEYALDIDSENGYKKTALNYALGKNDQELARWLLSQGADITKGCHNNYDSYYFKTYIDFVYSVVHPDASHDDFSYIAGIKNYDHFKDLAARCLKDLENPIKYQLLLDVIDQDISDENKIILDKDFSSMLCLRDLKTLERFIPLIIKKPKVLNIFEENLEKFTCEEYTLEIKQMVVNTRNNNILANILARTTFSDAQWRFV